MALEYPEMQLYVLFAVSVTFFGGVVLSEKLNSSWWHMFVPYLFVVASWGNIVFVFGGECLEVKSFLSKASWETGLHSLALLLFAISFLFVLPIGKKRAEPVFSEGDKAE